MADPLSFAKVFFSGLGSVFSYFSKKYAQPKLECDIVKAYPNSVPSKHEVHQSYSYVPVYHYEIRIINNSEHHAYHLQLAECDAEIFDNYLEYYKPVFSHDEITTHLNTTGEAIAPINRLVFSYANSKGKRFFTEFKPKEATEKRNEFGREHRK